MNKCVVQNKFMLDYYVCTYKQICEVVEIQYVVYGYRL